MLRIAVQNFSTVVAEASASAITAALQTQISRDLYPSPWGIWAGLYHLLPVAKPDADMWLLGIFDNSDQANALGYHDVTAAGLPIGKVFAKTASDAGYSVSVTASHELLEMLIDPKINDFCEDATTPDKFWIQESCDAVEADDDGYAIAGIQVSDFVLPAYFGQHLPGPWDFRGLLTGPVPNMRPQGYMSYVQNGQWGQVFGPARARQAPGRPGGSGRIERRMQKGAP